MPHWLIPALPWIGGLLSLGCLLASFRNFRRKSLSEELPTSRALGVFMGLLKMKGNAECEAPLQSALTEASCVHYRWSIEEEWERSSIGSDGKIETRSGWTTLGKGTETVPAFYVKDATGAILVHPQGAELDAVTVLNRTCGRDDDLYHGKGPAEEIDDSNGRRRFIEKIIRLHSPVYVIGKARERRDIVAAEIAADESAELFFISGYNEKEVESMFFWHGIGWSVLGVTLLVGGPMLRDYINMVDLAKRRPLYVELGAAYLGAWVFAWVWNVFNDLVGLRNRVREGWALIDIQLKRRFDLIPNIVRIVSALHDHEGAIQQHLALMRAQAGAPPTGKPGDGARALRPALAAVQEKFPVLTAMPAYLNLQKELCNTEERIALARDYYNNIATHFNTRIEQIPDRFVCLLTVMRRFDLLAAQDFERAAVKVEFAQ